LDAVPKEPIHKFLGSHTRCHFCGQIYNSEEGTKVQGRNKCPKCGGANG
jgi:phage FluMu protein Com